MSEINFYQFHLFPMNENVGQVEGLSFQQVKLIFMKIRSG
jgi:hypothetical protein